MEACIVVVDMDREEEDIVVVRVEDIVIVRVEGIVVVGMVVGMGNMGREDSCKDKVEEPDFGLDLKILQLGLVSRSFLLFVGLLSFPLSFLCFQLLRLNISQNFLPRYTTISVMSRVKTMDETIDVRRGRAFRLVLSRSRKAFVSEVTSFT